MQNITNIYNTIDTDLLKINEKSYIECICSNNIIYVYSDCENNMILRISQKTNNLFIQTKKCKIIFENLLISSCCKEYLQHKDIDDFLFFENIANKTKFLLIFDNHGFDINYTCDDFTYEIEKIYIDRYIDLDFDKKFIKNIIDDIITNTIATSFENKKYLLYFENKTKIYDILNLETEIRFDIKYDESLCYSNIAILLFQNESKIKMKEQEKANINIIKNLNSKKIVCSCIHNTIENMIEQYNDEIVFEINKQYVVKLN